MPKNLLYPEMTATPRNRLAGLLADALTGVRGFADQVKVPESVPLLGGQGVGSMFLGRAPEEVNELSYGNLPIQINPYAGRTASFVPEMKQGRGAQVFDAISLLPLPGARTVAGGLLGMPGANAAMFIGSKAKTWDAAAAARAIELEKAGVPAPLIWSKTGTLRGPDGLLRQEIDDSATQFVGNGNLTRATEALPHPALQQAYPDLSEVGVKWDQTRPEGGSLERGLGMELITANGPKDKARSVVLHELQHAVQQREGFAQGGNPKALIFEQYRRLAGEAEARATQARRDMTPAERRATFPLDSYDVPINQLIIR